MDWHRAQTRSGRALLPLISFDWFGSKRADAMTTKLEYKGYVAAVEFDEVEDILHGHVVNSGSYPIVTFEAEKPRMLRREFERSIDDYLQWCEQDGVSPVEPQPEVRIHLSLDLHAAVTKTAASRRMSVDEWIIQEVRQGVARWTKRDLA